jgi:hypothetical protein
MKTTLIAVAALSALGLAACQQAEESAPAASDAMSDTSTMAPADPGPGAMAPDATAPSTGAAPPVSSNDGTTNPDGTMNPGTPPTSSPDAMGASSGTTPPAQ